ncbi:MAG: Ig domain-containing protein [Bacteroidaceae bacterium]|nr:Ig domain-containing protein [Bacteroidaceae bacterium]
MYQSTTTNGGSTARTFVTYTIHVYEVTSISIPNSLVLSPGENYTFSPIIVQPEAQANLTWHSSNTAVATVDANGHLYANSAGVTTITCTAYNGVSAQCTVTVNSVLASSISLNYNTYELPKDEMVQLTATVLPENATNKGVRWESSNAGVATVDAAGNVVGVSAGTCTITATTTDGSNLSASCLVTVPAPSSDKLAVNDVVVSKGVQPRLNVRVVNKSDIAVLQFQLTLPEGFGVATPVLTERGQNLFVNMSDVTGKTNCKMFNVMSLNGQPLASGDGVLMQLPLTLDGSVAPGNYSALFDGVSFVPTNGSMAAGEKVIANITIDENQNATLGDMDGDGHVTVSDVTRVIDIYLEGNGE